MSRITTKYIFDYHDASRADYNSKASTEFNKTFMTYDQFKTSNFVADKINNATTTEIKSDKYDNYPVWKILKYICQIHNPNETTTNSYSYQSNMFGYFSNVEAIRSPLFAINTLDSINKELYLKADSVMFISASASNKHILENKDEIKELKFIDSTLSTGFISCGNLMSCNYLFNYKFDPKAENLSFINPQIYLNVCSQLTEVGLNDEINSLNDFSISNCPISYFEFPEKTIEMKKSVLRNCSNIYDVQINNNTEKQQLIVESCPNFTSCSIDLSINPTVFANTIKNLRIVIPESIKEIQTLISNNDVIEHLHIKNNSNNINYGKDFIENCPNLKTITGDYFKAALQSNNQRQYNFKKPINFENKYICFEPDSVIQFEKYNSRTFTFPSHMSRFYNMIKGFDESIINKNVDYKVDIKFLEDSSFGANAYHGVPNKIFELYEELTSIANTYNITISLRIYNIRDEYHKENMYHGLIDTIARRLMDDYPNKRRVSIHNDDFGSTIIYTSL